MTAIQPLQSTNARRGVTLLEVIVSMGVLVVGLMGMISLIPLGRLEMAEGDRLDNTSTLGRGAFRELTVRGYLNPQLWVHPVTGARVADVPGSGGGGVNLYGYRFTSPAVLPPFAPLVIDPLMCAPRFQHEGVNDKGLQDPGEKNHRERVQFFPYSTNLPGVGGGWPEETMPKLARATLRSYPINASMQLGNSMAHTMRFDLASRLFRSTDDLVIDVPIDDRSRRPVQVFSQSELTNLTVTAYDGVTTEKGQEQSAYRKFKGDYSWFFVVEPSEAERWSTDDQMPIAAGSQASPYTVHTYRVWVVICNKRDLRDTSSMDLSADRAVGERCVWLDFVDRYTARLRIKGVTDEGTAARVLDLKPNQWIAGAASFTNPLLGGKQTVLEWYRVLSVAERPTRVGNSDTWFREVALTGRDVSTSGSDTLGNKLDDADGFTGYEDMSGLNPQTSWGILIPGVRGVYEKTIYLDRPSMWAQQ